MKSESATGGVANTNYSNAFDYDGMGNRTRAENVSGGNTSVTQTTPNQLNQISALSSSVNGAPATTSGFAYDESGNTTLIESADGSKTVFTYDDADRLVRIEQRNAANAAVSKSEFIYDYASRKAVSREFTYTAGAWVMTDEKRRVFDGLDVVQERNEGNEVTAQLVRDGNIGGILARSTQAGKTFFGYDGGGNVTLLTDENGDDVGRYRYDAFGNTLEASGARAAENPYRFSTKELHAASGLYDYGYRFYSPGLGRWINRDPIQEAGGVNLYAMVGNDLVNSVDPYGLQKSPFWDPKAWQAIGQLASRAGPALSRAGNAISRGASSAGSAISRGASNAGNAVSRFFRGGGGQAAQRAAQSPAAQRAVQQAIQREQQWLANLPFKSGGMIQMEVSCSKGTMEMMARGIVEKGRVLHLQDIMVYPKGAKRFDLGAREMARLRSVLVQRATDLGFNGIRISGVRTGGANPGRSLDFTRTFKR